ncbi:hypothetical protein [Streptomyces xanthophaeus]
MGGRPLTKREQRLLADMEHGLGEQEAVLERHGSVRGLAGMVTVSLLLLVIAASSSSPALMWAFVVSWATSLAYAVRLMCCWGAAKQR